MPQYFADLGYSTVHIGKFSHHPDSKFPYDTVKLNRGADTDPQVREEVVNVLREHRREKPLLLVVCSNDPHMPWSKNRVYDPSRAKLPPNFVDTPETRSAMVDYYTDVTEMDRILGGVLDALPEYGYRDSLFVYTTDHGANFPFAKWCLYDEGIHVPLVVRWPGVVASGRTSHAMVSLADLLPTFMEVAGGSPPDDLDGRSFLNVLTGKASEHRDVIYATHTGNARTYPPENANHSPMRAIRTATHKYILNLNPDATFNCHITGTRPGHPHYLPYWDSWVERAKRDRHAEQVVSRFLHRPIEELYRLADDPYERDNLASRPESAVLLKSLRKQLSEWRRQQGDTIPVYVTTEYIAPAAR
jgi:arylsulfatase A-like enzyme